MQQLFDSIFNKCRTKCRSQGVKHDKYLLILFILHKKSTSVWEYCRKCYYGIIIQKVPKSEDKKMKVMKTTINRLCADKKIVSDKVVVYRLFHIRSCKGHHYSINVSADNESSTGRFGTNREKAFDIYHKIVRCEITPCTLRDIAEDFGKDL